MFGVLLLTSLLLLLLLLLLREKGLRPSEAKKEGEGVDRGRGFAPAPDSAAVAACDGGAKEDEEGVDGLDEPRETAGDEERAAAAAAASTLAPEGFEGTAKDNAGWWCLPLSMLPVLCLLVVLVPLPLLPAPTSPPSSKDRLNAALSGDELGEWEGDEEEERRKM